MCGGTTSLALKKLIKNVPFKFHVGDATTLALVELYERVPRLPECVILLAERLTPRAALPPVGAHQTHRLLWKIQRINQSQ